MSSYTMELRSYIESFSQFQEGLSLNDKIEIGRKHLFDFSYPIFDENFRQQFETNIIKNFYMREIGFETEGLFKMRLETWLNINMPYFNSLFESELIKYDPLINAQMRTTHNKELDRKFDGKIDTEHDKSTDYNENRDRNENRNTHLEQESQTDGTTTGNAKQTSESESKVKDDGFERKVSSDTPDTRLRLQTEDGKGVIEYASNIEETKNDNTTDSTGKTSSNTSTTDTSKVNSDAEQDENTSIDENERTNKDELEKFNRLNTTDNKSNEVEDFIENRVGKIGAVSQSTLIQEYRNALLRVELQIHNEMQELFMLVY